MSKHSQPLHPSSQAKQRSPIQAPGWYQDRGVGAWENASSDDGPEFSQLFISNMKEYHRQQKMGQSLLIDAYFDS